MLKARNRITYVAVLLFSVLFLFVGNRIASSDSVFFDDEYSPTYYAGVVLDIIDVVVEEDDEWGFGSITLYFLARITDGERRGEEVLAKQVFFTPTIYGDNDREVDVGYRIVLAYDYWSSSYYFANFARINYVLILLIIFLILVVLFARKKGFNAIVALGFTCMAVFLVFIPAILSGRNIYIATIIICCFAIVSTLLLVIGPNKKALSAMLGCLGGVSLAGILMFAMDIILSLTGILDQETRGLLFLPTETPINLRAIVFAGVIIGAVGAIMDVAMSISSSLWELKETGGVSDFGGIVKSGISIGKDILGTMLNTLILAYIGSSLSLILLITVHTTSLVSLFNMELIIVEFLRALVGSFGMLLTIPLTAGVCGWLYTNRSDDVSKSC